MTNTPESTIYIALAIAWARQRLGSTEYVTRCLAFVEDAYEIPNNIELFGGDTAKESADAYEAEGRTGVPPLGAFVFYNAEGELRGVRKNWGHVGLSTGDGRIIHCWDKVREDSYLAVDKLPPPPGWTPLSYIGWAPLERILKGYRVR